MEQTKEDLKIEIQQVALAEWERLEGLQMPEIEGCILYWAQEKQDIKLLFHSTQKSIRPLEFMDYLVQEYVLVEGDKNRAKAVLTPMLLQSMLSEYEAADIPQLFARIIDAYFSKCKWIYAENYAKEHEAELLSLPKYAKKKVTWAFVRTTDIVPEGKTFFLKSLENESEMTLTASPDLYVMIGRFGEIYHIRRARFEDSYETAGELLDPLEQMFLYLPEVRTGETGEFVALDELACVCWPKQKGGIYATCLEGRTKVFNPYNEDEYFVGKKGDYLAIRQDDLSDIYIIKNSIFHETYEMVR